MKNKIIKLLFSVGLLLFPHVADAGEARIVISTKGGVVAEFYLADDPVITYQDNLLVVKSSKSEVSVAAEDVAAFDFEPSSGDTGIDDVFSGNGAGGSRLSGLQPGSKVQVYNVEGRLVKTITVSADGKAELDMDALPGGVYIVKTQKTSFKITNKN